jgi:hypothetical protein
MLALNIMSLGVVRFSLLGTGTLMEKAHSCCVVGLIHYSVQCHLELYGFLFLELELSSKRLIVVV